MEPLLSLPLANWLGFVGSVCLLLPPARDQVRRFKRARAGAHAAAERASGREGWADIWTAVRDGYGERMSAWSPGDSAFTALGAALLAASYLIPPES